LPLRWRVRSVMTALFVVLAAALLATAAGWVPLVASAVVMLLGTMIFEQQIVRPVEDVARQALSVATGARNSVKHLNRSDELGLTLRAVGQLGLMCRWLINDVSSQVVSVRDGSDRLAKGNEDLNDRTRQTVANVQQTRVILDIGTHVLAMMRETVRYLGGDDQMVLQVISAKDRLGRDIIKGDLRTAEGEAHLQGNLSGIPVDIWLNKYAGPQGGQKGMRLTLRDGRIISHDRRGPQDVLTLTEGEHVQRWTLSGTLYEHCLAEQVLGATSLFNRAPDDVRHTTRRRLDEVVLLLKLQQQLRGPH
jgi:ribosomal protein L16/L10AE